MHLSHHHRLLPTESLRHREHGYILVLFALLLVPLLLMVGFAVDVGSWYSRASDMQKAADSAALAGVVWLPDLGKASSFAKEAAAKNGFDTGVSVVKVGDRRLKVTISDPSVGSFFYQSITGKKISLSRSGTAEYVLPVPLGSPENRFGNDPTATPAFTPNLWASISAPYADLNNGDPYSTKCGRGASGSACTQSNTEYRNWGYLYVIDVPVSQVGKNLDLKIYDAGQYSRPSYPNVETADNGSVNTQFELFRPDSTPLDALDGLTPAYSQSGKCASGPGIFRLPDNTDSGIYKNKWVSICNTAITAANTGQWILQVKSSNIPTIVDGGSGWNQFSINATLSGTVQPTVYTVGDLSLFNNLPGLVGDIDSTFYLAKIDQIHASKTLEVSLFDPGDGLSGDYFLNVLGPGGSSQPCKFSVRGEAQTSLTGCRIQTRKDGSNTYNGKWLDIQVPIPNNYTCTDCWWKVKYEFKGVTAGNSPNDRTVWSARVIGDPVHIIEDT